MLALLLQRQWQQLEWVGDPEYQSSLHQKWVKWMESFPSQVMIFGQLEWSSCTYIYVQEPLPRGKLQLNEDYEYTCMQVLDTQPGQGEKYKGKVNHAAVSII